MRIHKQMKENSQNRCVLQSYSSPDWWTPLEQNEPLFSSMVSKTACGIPFSHRPMQIKDTLLVSWRRLSSGGVNASIFRAVMLVGGFSVLVKVAATIKELLVANSFRPI